MKNLFTKSLVSLLAITSLVLPSVASAATGSGSASLHFATGSSYTVGQTITVAISETSSALVGGVEADVTYPSNLLKCNGPATLGAFANQYQNTCAGGALTLAVGVQGTPVSGTQTVGVVSFTVLASGTASIKVANSSEIDDTSTANVCDSSCNGGATAANYNLSAPVQPSNPTPPTSGGNTGGSSSTTPSTPAKTGTGNTGGTGSSTSTNNGSTTAAPSTGTSNQTQKQNQGHKTTNKPAPKHIKSHHAGVVTSALALIVVAAGAYWLIIRKRTEVAPVKTTYKLDTTSKSKTAGKKPIAHKATAKKKTTKK